MLNYIAKAILSFIKYAALFGAFLWFFEHRLPDIKLLLCIVPLALVEAAWLIRSKQRRSLAALNSVLDPAIYPAPSDKVVALVRGGQNIEAIKAYRMQTGLGLRQSKDMIDKIKAEQAQGQGQ
jgi:hypothetical protein